MAKRTTHRTSKGTKLYAVRVGDKFKDIQTYKRVHALALAPRPVNRNILALVEGLLDRVKAGEVLAVGLVEVGPAGEVATAHARDGQYHRLHSGAARLAHQLASETD